MIIRPETFADYAAVARLHVRAFDARMDEAVIVALLRQRPAYVPALALVAELDGVVAGHAMFTPVTVRLKGEDIAAVLLAPLAVDPMFQRRGIGAALIEAGHDAARKHGASLSFLLGHSTYYPRFGYQTHAFGSSSAAVSLSTLESDELLVMRKPAESDLPALLALWEREEGAVDFGLKPEASSLVDWLSPNPQVVVTVYERDGVVVGCTRVHQAAPTEPRLFHAADEDAAHAMALQVAQQTDAASLTLPLHPASASASIFGGASVQTYDAAMAAELTPCILNEYLADIRAQRRAPGRPLWPSAFDLA